MVCSKNIPEIRAEELQSILEFNNMENNLVSMSKKEIFACIRERVWKKLQGWKEQLLSKAGKEILIKAVAQSIPTYAMGCFKLPEYSCSELKSLASNFWWGQKEGARKIHWVKRSEMCKGKKNGGMGFRDLRTFNMAMLTKQAWRIPHDTNILFTRSRKGDIFRQHHSCVLNWDTDHHIHDRVF
ncbi:unnamed protein product [Ilex paraguariensis]|uniref:Reverse transcriptase n=1 Tax=Ilex paraguariensis TaxID=185542 RepID=A0ABC8TAC7_9AQUA